MKKLICVLLLLSMCISISSCMPNLNRFAISFADEKIDINKVDITDHEYVDFLKKIEEFSTKLTSEIYTEKGTQGNFCISPISVYMSLAIACESSSGETRQEILDAVGVTYEQVKSFTKYLYAISNKEFVYDDGIGNSGISAYGRLSNSIWLKEGLIYNKNAVDALNKDYNCDVFAASFEDRTAENMINQYIEYKTSGVISSDNSFSRSTALSIISVYYLKEVWNELGRNLPLTLEYHDFENTDKSISSTRLLRGYYAKGQVYSEEKFSSFFTEMNHGYKIHFIVPNEKYTLSDVYNEENINKIINLKDYGYIDEENKILHNTRLLFPEFSVSFNGNLDEIMKENFGIEKLFSMEECDFSGITSDDGVYCEHLLHKCELEVNQKGIEGSETSSVQKPPIIDKPEYENVYHDFNIERAFGFVITDPQGIVIYSGVVNYIN